MLPPLISLTNSRPVALQSVFSWFNNNLDIGKFTSTTSLFLVNFSVLNPSSDGFFVSNLRSTLVTFYLEFSFQPIDQNLQVQFTHTRDHSLT